MRVAVIPKNLILIAVLVGFCAITVSARPVATEGQESSHGQGQDGGDFGDMDVDDFDNSTYGERKDNNKPVSQANINANVESIKVPVGQNKPSGNQSSQNILPGTTNGSGK